MRVFSLTIINGKYRLTLLDPNSETNYHFDSLVNASSSTTAIYCDTNWQYCVQTYNASKLYIENNTRIIALVGDIIYNNTGSDCIFKTDEEQRTISTGYQSTLLNNDTFTAQTLYIGAKSDASEITLLKSVFDTVTGNLYNALSQHSYERVFKIGDYLYVQYNQYNNNWYAYNVVNNDANLPLSVSIEDDSFYGVSIYKSDYTSFVTIGYGSYDGSNYYETDLQNLLPSLLNYMNNQIVKIKCISVDTSDINKNFADFFSVQQQVYTVTKNGRVLLDSLPKLNSNQLKIYDENMVVIN